MNSCYRGLLLSSLAALAGCLGPDADPGATFTPRAGPVQPTGRAVLAEFTIHFDQDGGTVEVTSPDAAGIPTAAVRLMNATARESVPGTDVLLETLLAYLDPVLGNCLAGDWGYEVRLTNDGAVIWHSPIAQLIQIVPGTVTSCNTVDTGLGLPGGGVAVAEFPYGVSLAPTAAATAHWCFDPAGATDFTVKGRITIGDGPPTCGGLPLGDPGLCSGHGDCIAEDYCECAVGYEATGPTCTDIDACTPNPCYAGVDCTDLPPPDPGTGFTCGDCPQGMSGDGVTCTSDCPAGYWEVVGGTVCADIDECAAGTHDCPAGTECVNGCGDFTCAPTCFGLSQDAPGVCSGHGDCADVDTCDCTHPWEAPACAAEKTCAGVAWDSGAVCGGHGTCVAQDECECDPFYWTGPSGPYCLDDLECGMNGQYWVGPYGCNFNGECVFDDNDEIGRCVCTYGFAGPTCGEGLECDGIPFNHEDVCAGRGTCQGDGTCDCDEGYGGDFCVDDNRKCGSYFHWQAGVCHDHGDCLWHEELESYECDCYQGYYSSYYYPDCQGLTTCNFILWNNSTVCSGNGACVDLDTCDCDQGYGGTWCNELCDPTCADGELSPGETGVDCGGFTCPSCP